MTKQQQWLLGLGIAFGTFFLIILMIGYLSGRQTDDTLSLPSSGEKIGIIELVGPIYESHRMVRQFEQMGKQRSIKAIVFRVDSPGGGVAASQEIYEAVKRVRDSGKPVVASFGSVAASGGYYVACGADTIVANPGTTTGSIGVIAEFMNAGDLLKKIGIQFQVIKSGRFKDTGGMHRALTEADKAYLQSWIDDAYDQFMTVVHLERNMTMNQVRLLADGRVFTGRQGLENGLIDVIGDYETAIDIAAGMADIDGKPDLVRIGKRNVTLFDLFFQQVEGVLRGLNGVSLKYSL